MADQLSKSDYETFDAAAAKISSSDPKFARIKASIHIYLTSLDKWKSIYEGMVAGLKRKIERQAGKGEENLAHHRQEMIEAARKTVELIDYDIAQLGSTAQILADDGKRCAPSAKALPRDNSAATHTPQSSSSAPIEMDTYDHSYCAARWRCPPVTEPNDGEMTLEDLDDLDPNSRPGEDEEGTPLSPSALSMDLTGYWGAVRAATGLASE